MSSSSSSKSTVQLSAWEHFNHQSHHQQQRPSTTVGNVFIMPSSSSSNCARTQRHRFVPLALPGIRYAQLVLGTLYLSIILGCVICFNPAITVMMNISTSPLFNNGSFVNQSAQDFAPSFLPLADRRFNYTNLQKSFLLGGTFGACLLQILPVGYAMQIFGAKRTQLFIGIAVSLATGLMPLAASTNFYALFVARMVNGLAITNLFPVVGAICTNWAPLKERGVFLAILSGYIQLSVIISMPISGFLVDKFGWPSVFYVHAFIGLSLSLWWALFYRDDPMAHPLIGHKELALIRYGKRPATVGKDGTSKHGQPPYRQIFSSASIWAIFCAVFGNFLIVQFFNTFLPMFLVSSLHYSNAETGLLSALPLILQFFVKWLTGFITDHLPSVKDINKFCILFSACLTLFSRNVSPLDRRPLLNVGHW
ncbi:hypothetical protein niasHT_033647 [Heterodera trifolii]|uniref:Major facilitator superfamily (MFS) profile domain-containing protein n=1 Tax=Heterodera trifolii TaxID=157864 RepID=A0ABD2IAQ6_9BILA